MVECVRFALVCSAVLSHCSQLLACSRQQTVATHTPSRRNAQIQCATHPTHAPFELTDPPASAATPTAPDAAHAAYSASTLSSSGSFWPRSTQRDAKRPAHVLPVSPSCGVCTGGTSEPESRRRCVSSTTREVRYKVKSWKRAERERRRQGGSQPGAAACHTAAPRPNRAECHTAAPANFQTIRSAKGSSSPAICAARVLYSAASACPAAWGRSLDVI